MSTVFSTRGAISGLKLSSKRLVTAFGLVIALSTAASAAPLAHTSGPNLGVVSIGDVEIQLTASGGDGVHYAWEFVPGFGALPYGVSVRTDTPPWFSTS